jgi:hypothetical protein
MAAAAGKEVIDTAYEVSKISRFISLFLIILE